MPTEVKYGLIRGGEQGAPIVVVTTQFFGARSSKFCKRQNSTTEQALIHRGETGSEIIGHLEIEEVSSTDGTEVRKLINDPTAIYRVPVLGGSFTANMRNKLCNLTWVSGIQGADLNAGAKSHLLVIDGDLSTDTAFVDVRIFNLMQMQAMPVVA